jgi:hypothetical protein
VSVIIICCVVLGMYLVSLTSYLATSAATDPVEAAKRAKEHSRELYQKMGKDLPKEVQEKLDQNFDKVMGGKEMQALYHEVQSAYRWGLIRMLCFLCLDVALLICLYMRQDWARVILGVLFLIGAGLGLIGIVFGGLAAIRFLGGGAAFLAGLDMLFWFMVNLCVGLALLKSESIQAYTTGK